jgi:hypothetical protein
MRLSEALLAPEMGERLPDRRRSPAVPVLILCFGLAAQDRRLRERAAGADVIGCDLDGAFEGGIAGQAEDEVDVVFLAEIGKFILKYFLVGRPRTQAKAARGNA